eukprot:1161190-Pelagomonas_calceolata.AAC.1
MSPHPCLQAALAHISCTYLKRNLDPCPQPGLAGPLCRLVGEGKRRLLQRLQAHAHNEQGGGESQQLQQKDVLVPSKTLLVIVPGLIEVCEDRLLHQRRGTSV